MEMKEMGITVDIMDSGSDCGNVEPSSKSSHVHWERYKSSFLLVMSIQPNRQGVIDLVGNRSWIKKTLNSKPRLSRG